MGRRIGALVLGLLVFVAVSGSPERASAQGTGDDRSAASAVRALTSSTDDATADDLPADFTQVMGYTPQVQQVGGRDVLLRADGGCSSPLGATAYDFTPACRQHDLGYDVLRYADRKGHPLGSWARHAVDQAFSTHLHQGCDTRACAALADVYAGAVDLNSVRQRYLVPSVETPFHWLAALLAGLVASLLLLGLRRARTAAVMA
ncbi:hypothetical protein GCM10027446_18150 [Angustibacter peucedani]